MTRLNLVTNDKLELNTYFTFFQKYFVVKV
jgi:hypothetical protein